MKKVFISVAVRGLTKEQTEAKHEEYRNKIADLIGEYEDISINNPDREPFTGITAEKPAVYWMGLGLQKELAKADLAVFCGDIEATKGCRIEKLICELYDIPHIVIK